MEIFFF